MSVQIATNILSISTDAAIAQDAGLNLDVPLPRSLGGYGNSRGVVQGIVITSQENLAWDILFFGKSAHGTTYDTDSYLGHWPFNTADAIQYSNDAISGAWRYSVQGLGIPFQDLDAVSSTIGSLHVTIVPRGAAHVIHDRLVLTFFVSPEVPWSGA